MTGTRFTMELRPRIPPELGRLTELADDLYFSWDRYTRGLFYYLDDKLWDECRHNPKLFLRRVSQKRLEEAARDRAFLEEYQRTVAYYDIYLKDSREFGRKHPLEEQQIIAFFCAEFGLHESLPIYSGGLGILAGDFCKAASDLAMPFVAVGLFYRAGNLLQTVDHDGRQQTHYEAIDSQDLPIRPVYREDGQQLTVTVDLAGTPVVVRIWRAKAGHSSIYLLDTEAEENRPADRAITQQLYPGDKEARLRQEMIMGLGGVRALRAVGIHPTVWHINEGHPSLVLLECCRELVRDGMEFHAALEVVAAASVFTTHTPVTAGHEVYDIGLIRTYFAPLAKDMGIGVEELIALGSNAHQSGFNLTSYAMRCARYYNGVSRIHRRVAAQLEQHVWPEIPVEENPICHVNNGIHVPTFIARNWISVLDDPGWYNELLNPEYWQRIRSIPDATFWSVRLALKAILLRECRRVVEQRGRRNGLGEIQIARRTALLRSPDDVMVIGFARRFATYKRATLLFEDPDRLARLLNDPQRPVLLIFAGRAHPSDEPGKELIRHIHDFSMQPRFQGKVILLEGYDLGLARKLVAGADVWLNVPEYPMEASGTSGMKAAINGSVNLGILDGWWAEGCTGQNGWGLQPHDSEQSADVRRRLEAQDLLDILENEVLPLYFDKAVGYSEGWVQRAKESMQTVIPRFNAQRMVMDYIDQLYLPAIENTHKLAADKGVAATELARWKKEVRRCWSGVSLRKLEEGKPFAEQGEEFQLKVAVRLNGLKSDDVIVECLVGKPQEDGDMELISRHLLTAAGEADGYTIFQGRFALDLSGLIAYKLRIYPSHPLLCRRFEMGFMKWA